jgi:hypothetical protein
VAEVLSIETVVVKTGDRSSIFRWESAGAIWNLVAKSDHLRSATVLQTTRTPYSHATSPLASPLELSCWQRSFHETLQGLVPEGSTHKEIMIRYCYTAAIIC